VGGRGYTYVEPGARLKYQKLKCLENVDHSGAKLGRVGGSLEQTVQALKTGRLRRLLSGHRVRNGWIRGHRIHGGAGLLGGPLAEGKV